MTQVYPAGDCHKLLHHGIRAGRKERNAPAVSASLQFAAQAWRSSCDNHLQGYTWVISYQPDMI